MINSVLGKIKIENLKITLMHEHITCYNPAMKFVFKNKWIDEVKLIEIASKQLKKAKLLYGINTIIDGTPINLGRNVNLIKEVSKKSGVNIIISSGFYFTDEPFLNGKSPETIAELLINECINGVEGSSILPGILKCATDKNGFTDINVNLLKATAITQRCTNIPLFVHSFAKDMIGVRQLEILKNSGADISKVIIGHCGDINDIDYFEKLLSSGCYIGLDRFGVGEKSNSLENRINTLIKLKNKGWLKKIIISHDFASYIDWGTNDWKSFTNSDYLNLDVDYTLIHRKVIPILFKNGFTDSDINQLLINNPIDLFTVDKN